MMKNPKRVIQDNFTGGRRLRPHAINHFGGIEAAKCHPMGIMRFRPDEGGTVSTNLKLTLAPVSGYMRSKAYVDVKQIFVPYQAIEKLYFPNKDDAGVTEMVRRRLQNGNGVGLENSNDISRAAFVHGRSVSSNTKVQESVRLAYIAAVNHLRLHAYHAAILADNQTDTILPAILTANVLERFDGVLEPENLVDGAINLTGELPVKGIGIASTNPMNSGATAGSLSNVKEGEGEVVDYAGGQIVAGTDSQYYTVLEEDPDNLGHPNMRADLSGAGEITLRDMMESKKLDALVRQFSRMIKDDPVHGEERVERALYGISVDFDDDCQVLYDQVHELSPMHTRPTDGASINDVSANFTLDDTFATIVPRSELGGQLVTIVMVKPLETLSYQPDPAQTEGWELVNRIQDELALDEVLLTRQDLESEVAAVDQDTPVFWVGHNSLKHKYSTQGPNFQQIDGVEMKSSMWTYEVPTSVTPENISYPDEIDMYPFYNWNGAHAEYQFSQVAAISTSLARGPSPVERIQLFADDPDLVNVD